LGHQRSWRSGIYPGARNTRDGLRITTNDAYLETARERSNLTILGRACVDRIVLDRRRAVGVRIEVSGAAQTIEGGIIILSAGTIHSPAILMRSGVGDATQLRELAITPVADLPAVGENLCDHPLMEIRLELRASARSSPSSTLAYNCGLRTKAEITQSGLPRPCR
jgi:choline dehydrogenase-like flavoprotein